MNASTLTTPTPPSLKLETGLAMVLPFIALSVGMFSPYLAYFIGAAAVFLSARATPRLAGLALFSFASAGSMIFASRDLTSASSDFVNYFENFEAICHGASFEFGLGAYGPEMGLPLFYAALSSLGLCNLSQIGLAYVQCLLTSFALLQIGFAMTRAWVPERERAVVITGMCLLLSFFFITQLSRQALSSLFLLYALWLAGSRRAALAALALATFFHFTAPLLYLLVLILRRARWWFGLVLLGLVLFGLTRIDDILDFAADAEETFVALGKLLYYSNLDDDAGNVASDILVVVYLLLASLPMLLSRKGSVEERRDARMLLGFALISSTLLILPLAATRFALPFGALAVGYFMFWSLARWWFLGSCLLLALLLLVRALTLGVPGEGAEHALWTNYPSWSAIPGYFMSSFFR